MTVLGNPTHINQPQTSLEAGGEEYRQGQATIRCFVPESGRKSEQIGIGEVWAETSKWMCYIHISVCCHQFLNFSVLVSEFLVSNQCCCFDFPSLIPPC